MANKNSTKFTFLFATAMVVVVAVLLSLASIGLAPFQAQNVKLEKMQNILASIGIEAEAKNAEKVFNSHIREQIVLNAQGQQVRGDIKAFDIDLKKELDKARIGQADKQLFPLFVFEKDSQKYYVVPVRGKGLWGPIWGYVAVGADMNTVLGASFGHKGETPGLGAEIETVEFQKQFVGKKIFDDGGKFVSVRVIKGGAAPDDPHGVDAVSGGTITSNGVTEMLKRTLGNYVAYFKSINGSDEKTTLSNSSKP